MKQYLTDRQTSKRNSGIELLKIIAIIIIAISHTMPVTGETKLFALNIATTDIQIIIAQLLRCLGSIGNAIFVVCSAWFLIDSNKVNLNKIAHIVGDSLFISVLWLMITVLSGYDVSAREAVKQILPITFALNWFVGCYLLLYSIHPLLNKIINNCSKRTLLLINLISFMAYCVIDYVAGGMFYYYNLFIGFIVLYFFTAYIKRYLTATSSNLKLNIASIILGVFGWTSLFIANDLAGEYIPFLSSGITRWKSFLSPFCLMIVFGLFNIFKNIKFYNKFVNYISGLSLLIYIIHENYFVYTRIRNDIFSYIESVYTLNSLVLWIALLSLLTIIISVIVASLYKATIQKIVHKISDFIVLLIIKIYNHLERIILKFE